MAAAIGATYSDDEITEILASIERIPCFEKDKISNYKVSSSNVFVNLKASSSFEAATKFGFVLRQVGLASSSTPDCLQRRTLPHAMSNLTVLKTQTFL